MTTAVAPSLSSFSERLSLILRNLRAMIAARGGRNPAMGPIFILIVTRLTSIASRFELLVARLARGRTMRPHRPRVRPARVVDRPVGAPRLPREWAWLVRLIQETAQLGSQIEAMLAEPGMAALLAATPGAGGIIRPLCHMLAIDPPPALTLPGSRKPGQRSLVVKKAPVAPDLDEAAAISLIWATMRAQGLVETPEPVTRKPPWRGWDLGR